MYDNSLQEQQYLSAVRAEKEAFEQLIKYKASVVLPKDQVRPIYDRITFRGTSYKVAMVNDPNSFILRSIIEVKRPINGHPSVCRS